MMPVVMRDALEQSHKKPQAPKQRKLKSRCPATGDAAGKSDCSAA